MNTSPSLIAGSSVDRTISIYDTRILASSKPSTLSSAPVAVLSLFSSASSGLPSALAPSPAQPHHLASGGSDSAVRIWDVRAPNSPLAGFRAGQQLDKANGNDRTNQSQSKGQGGDAKVLALAWTRGLLAAGGEAGLDVWRVPEPGAVAT